MSTLRVNTIKNKTSGFNNVVQFTDGAGTENGVLCRAWVNFDGTFATSPFTVANGGIRAAFNVSSVTDNGPGNYTINFTNAMPDANYAWAAGWENINAQTRQLSPPQGATYTTSSINLVYQQGGLSTTDQDHLCVCIFR